jgi:hypothetical protein
MKIIITVLIFLGAILMAGSVCYASAIDTQDYSKQTATTYFVDTDANKYNAPYYRWYNQDWGWTHTGIASAATALTATLNISAFDIDWASGEVDKVYAYDNGVKTLLGTLTGDNDQWSYTTFTLGSNFYDDIVSGLQVYLDIDSTNNEDVWAVTVAKSVISIDGGELPDPDPSTTPEPCTLLLMGIGLGGGVLLRRKMTKHAV